MKQANNKKIKSDIADISKLQQTNNIIHKAKPLTKKPSKLKTTKINDKKAAYKEESSKVNMHFVQEESETFNFKSNTKFLNIAKLIKENKILDLEKMLKSNTINPNQRDEDGATCSWTPLYWSVKLNKIDCVELLLNNGADVNLVVNDPFECYGTALDLATLLGHEEIEAAIRKFMNRDGDLKSAFKAVRTKLRGNAPAFNFKSAKRQRAEMEEIEQARQEKKEKEALAA